MILYWSPKSPFVRKVMIAVHELGLAERIELVRMRTTMLRPNEDLLPTNPLSKIPTLIRSDGRPLYDSLTICEYLDDLAGGALFPPAGNDRWDALQWHSLANGLLDIVILWRNEREKPEAIRFQTWFDAFALKTDLSIDRFEEMVSAIAAAPFGIGHIALGCCLSYLDFRFADVPWRDRAPALATWYAEFCERPSVKATEVVDD